ncbi:MAG: NucA/NucB deoxyribonuclease domain-containing protein, partial [Angustibacter sp.]
CRRNAIWGGYPKTDCGNTPIFAPGTDILEAARHDQHAITTGQPAKLEYATKQENAERGIPQGWYKTSANQPNECTGQTGLDTGMECDEYPFYSTKQAGPGASLEPVNVADNQKEGRLLNGFYTVCGLKDEPRRPFLTVPVIDIPSIPTTGWC